MKWIIVLNLVFVVSGVSAETIASGDVEPSAKIKGAPSTTEVELDLTEGKINAALNDQCRRDYPSFRKVVLAENATDLMALETLQEKTDLNGDSEWFKGLGQLIDAGTQLQNQLNKPLPKVGAKRCDAIMIQRAEIQSVLSRAPKYH